MSKKSKGFKFYVDILWRFMSPHWKLFFVSILMTLLYSISNVYIMPLVKDIFREVSNKNLSMFSNHIINAFILFSIRLNSSFFQRFVMQKLSRKVLIDMRTTLFRIIHYLPSEHYNNKKHGDILSRIMDDCSKIQSAIFLIFETLLPSVLTLTGVVGYLFYINWYLTGLTIVGAPIFFFTLNYFSKRLRRVSKQIQQSTADITQMIQESFANMKIIKIYLGENRNVNRFKQIQKRYFYGFIREIKFKIYREQIDAYLQFAIFLAVFWFGGYLVLNDQLSSANFVSFFTGIILLVDPIVLLTKVYANTYQVTASIDRVNELLKKESFVIDDEDKENRLSVMFDKLEFVNVSFSYPSTRKMVIRDLSFSLNKGEILGVVGPSGGGKSTMVNLINKFYLSNKGKILIDGKNINDIHTISIREKIAYVPQESILFRGSILDNCRTGWPKASVNDVIEALKIANAWDFVNDFPEKLLTKIGAQGLNLSGGQRQRISIARAILSQPSLLILDEATSALDTKSEAIIQKSIDNLKGKFTMIIIAHRLSTVIDATNIIVIDEGRIVETGKHQELLKKQGIYYELAKKQTSLKPESIVFSKNT